MKCAEASRTVECMYARGKGDVYEGQATSSTMRDALDRDLKTSQTQGPQMGHTFILAICDSIHASTPAESIARKHNLQVTAQHVLKTTRQMPQHEASAAAPRTPSKCKVQMHQTSVSSHAQSFDLGTTLRTDT